MRVGFAGVGKMGAPMASRLLRGGNEVTVYDIDEGAMNALRSLGAQTAASLTELAAHSDVVFTVLPTEQHVLASYLADDGLLASARPGTILIDCSTCAPRTARYLYQKGATLDITICDAPVSGGTKGAQDGTLTFLVGASAHVIEIIRPTLMKMGSSVFHCGGPGCGQAAKISNNLALGISTVAICEAMALGVKLGVDPLVLSEAINASTGRCWASAVNNPWPGTVADAPSSHDYAPGGTTEVMIKDLTLARDAALLVGHPFVGGSVALEQLQSSSSLGHAQKDFSSMIKLYIDPERYA